MTPFSSAYYLKKNPKRTIGILFMLISMAICYLGGIYVKCMLFHLYRTTNQYKDSARLIAGYGCTQEEYDQFCATLENLPSVSALLPVSTSIYVTDQNEMNIKNTFAGCIFTDPDDLDLYFRTTGLVTDPALYPKERQAILSSSLAKNTGLSIGDRITKKTNEYNAEQSFQVSAIFPSDDFYLFALDSQCNPYCSLVVRNAAEDGDKQTIQKQFASDLSQLNIPNSISFDTYDRIIQENEKNFAFTDSIYYAIIVLITVVLFVTINAAFVGAYEKRNFEFAVYDAMGFGQKKIFKKVIGEILLLDLLGFAGSAGISMLTLYLVNQLLLYPNGMGLPYYTTSAFVATLICNALVILPTLLLRLHSIRHLDLTA